MADAYASGTRLHGLVLRITTGWAILGGLVLMAVVAVNVASVVGAAVFNAAVPGDFELTEVGVAVAAFSFLPYCQIAGLNVSADIFTARASKFWLSLFSLLGALVALGFGAILLWRMYYGMLDKQTYGETTAILSIPTWYGYLLVLPSLALLVLASVASVVDSVSNMAKR
ncbi:TRAP transporter small permease [Psychromarinibacter halotolerans]|uniref:TRAP transporter small permease protein n=1 Tax=Psychromarinibacter halotolerans TaxID=1775175 RepID=A0ABV7GMT6_9RHOB|nr:TRAP transporter small permease [Psychromarinibacter halotolerans]MDF0595746.1 TRAP transporter small permease [Psychromarinibacter halotolerans]